MACNDNRLSPELLAPAGDMARLRAAIANGADAVYLGMQRFGARAYSDNFDESSVTRAVAYAHLRGVSVYVTVNTIVYQAELDAVFAQLDFLNSIGVDGVIVQDLAVLDYVASHFEDMEAHISTQVGIDDVDGARLCKRLGAKRVVVARECDTAGIARIREQADIAVEVFAHGALCISYSGNCLMSGLTGNRLGNRGRCIGSCRKLYRVVDSTANTELGENYILSAKDLCTFSGIDDLRCADSLKIEGRMRETAYVANVVRAYRAALDGSATPVDRENLAQTFNRTFTKGYVLGEDRFDIVNAEKANHYGFEIGVIDKVERGRYRLKLHKPLNQNDSIRIDSAAGEVCLTVARIYDGHDDLISGANDTCVIKLRERLAVGDMVYKTRDVAFMKQIEGCFEGEYRRFPLDFHVSAYVGAPLVVTGSAFGLTQTWVAEEPLAPASKQPATLENVSAQLDRLNTTVFCLGAVTFEGDDAFIPAKVLNTARKWLVDELAHARIAGKLRRVKEARVPSPIGFEARTPYLTASVATEEQYQACLQAGIDVVYFENIVPRNSNEYRALEGDVLVGGMGGIEHYRGTNEFVTDYSLNVVNATACRVLHELGAKRVTLSYEMNADQINQLIGAYMRENGQVPALEMIVYGHAPLLVTKYCPLKKMGQCGACKKHSFELREGPNAFPLVTHENCNCTVLNGKVHNLLDEMSHIEGVEAFRLAFTIESPDEVARVVSEAQGKLNGTLTASVFNQQTDTRGHFNKEIL